MEQTQSASSGGPILFDPFEGILAEQNTTEHISRLRGNGLSY
jgi:hypothetical protein